DGGELLRRLPAHLSQDGVTALVFNFIDQLTHGRSESAILYEVARDEAALRSLTRTWFERSPVRAALLEAERRGVTVLLTTDHGSIHCTTPATVYAKRDATANLRYKFGEDLRSEDPEAAIAVEDLKAFGLPGMGLGVRLLRPYTLLFTANIAATLVAALLDGATFVLVIPFLRAVFKLQALPTSGSSAVERVLERITGPLLTGAAPEVALRNVVLVLVVALVVKNAAAYGAAMSSVAIEEGVVRD